MAADDTNNAVPPPPMPSDRGRWRVTPAQKVRGLDSDVGDGAYHAQPNVGTEDEPACEMETPSAGLVIRARRPSYDSDQE
jgi:hypothetical protein